MTRTHFQLIADVIATLEDPAPIAAAFAKALASTNPRFDQARFIAAATKGRA